MTATWHVGRSRDKGRWHVATSRDELPLTQWQYYAVVAEDPQAAIRAAQRLRSKHNRLTAGQTTVIMGMLLEARKLDLSHDPEPFVPLPNYEWPDIMQRLIDLGLINLCAREHRYRITIMAWNLLASPPESLLSPAQCARRKKVGRKLLNKPRITSFADLEVLEDEREKRREKERREAFLSKPMVERMRRSMNAMTEEERKDRARQALSCTVNRALSTPLVLREASS